MKIKYVISDIFHHADLLYKERRGGHDEDQRRVDILLEGKKRVKQGSEN